MSCLSSTQKFLGFAALTAATSTMAFAQEEGNQAELMRRIERLEKQNATLRTSYTQARQDAESAEAKLQEIKARLEALGGAALGEEEERIVQAVADLDLANQRIQALESSSVKLSGAIIAYMKQALTEDSAARASVETSLREVDAALGLRQEPVRDGAGTLAEAQVLSMDSDSGLLVLNVGREVGIRVGMPLKVLRGTQTIADAIVTDVRKEVAGALIQKLQSSTDPVKVGDSASVKTNE